MRFAKEIKVRNNQIYVDKNLSKIFKLRANEINNDKFKFVMNYSAILISRVRSY